MASDGNFYGTSANGGASGVGTVFKVTPEGQETVLHSFSGGDSGTTDGASPFGRLVEGRDGNFYGTTSDGGDNGSGVASRGGTVYKISPGGSETVLHFFTQAAGSLDGIHPVPGLTLGSDGNLYGAASGYAGGIVYEITPAGVETVIYAFDIGSKAGLDAKEPWEMVVANDGSLCGVTESGGANSVGTIFRLSNVSQ